MEFQGYERADHEVLSVHHQPRKDGKRHPATGLGYHVIKQQHTMYAHTELTMLATASIGVPFAVAIRLHAWDDEVATLTGEDRTFTLLVNGEAVGEINTVDGEGSVQLQLNDAGTYAIAVQHPTAAGASAEVVVS